MEKAEGGDDIPSKMSLMAAQISSFVHSSMPSTRSLQILKHSSPTTLTAVPSLNGPTSSSTTLSPLAMLFFIASPSTVSTP